jgi:uncharacterized membrane protein
MRRLLALCVALGALAISAMPAHAAYRLCNHTSYVLYAAIGFQAGSELFTQGWSRIPPGFCATPIVSALKPATYYIYARTSDAHAGPVRAWGGRTNLCAKPGDFSLHTSAAVTGCTDNDAGRIPFAAVEVRGKTDWTTNFTEARAFADPNANQRAGIQRLLADSGYAVGAPDAAPSARTDAALTQFRTRMKIAANATLADVFEALEDEAARHATPQGYAVCNTTSEPIFAAVATRSGGNWNSRGWWKVAPTVCARVITEPLATDRVFLLVERGNGTRLVTGTTTFCTTEVQFDITGRDNCAKRGLANEGFFATVTQGRRGYTARVGEEGLEPPARR